MLAGNQTNIQGFYSICLDYCILAKQLADLLDDQKLLLILLKRTAKEISQIMLQSTRVITTYNTSSGMLLLNGDSNINITAAAGSSCNDRDSYYCSSTTSIRQ